MSNNPTIKVRLAIPGNHWGADCGDEAKKIIGDRAEILAVKWARPEAKWIEDGRDWGNKPRLTEWQRGYIDAIKATAADDSTEMELIGIIRGLAR